MTNTFRRHHKTIMWIIIAGTIVSFVVFLSPNMRSSSFGGGGSGGKADLGSIFREPVTVEQFQAAEREAKLAVYLQTGRWPTIRDQGADVVKLAYQRLLLDAEINQLNIQISTDAEARFTRQVFGVPDDQSFPKQKFEEFVKTRLIGEGHVGLEDFDRFIRHQVGNQILLSLYGMNGQLITPKEAEYFFRRENETMSVERATFEGSNYLAGLTIAPGEIESFYTNRIEAYRVPDRVRVDYIVFEATNFAAAGEQIMGTISNLDMRIEQQYVSADPASYKDSAGNQLSAEAAKAKIKDDLRKAVSSQAAYTNAIDLAKRLFDAHSTNNPITKADLQQLAATNGLKLVTSEPFDAEHPPQEWQMPPQNLQMVFQMNAGDPEDQYRVMQGTNGSYLVGLEQSFPSQNQPLDAVRAKVTEDYRTFKAASLARQAGAKFAEAAQAAIDKGQSFESVCAAQKVKRQVLTPFALVTTSIPEIEDKDEFEALERTVFEVATGKVSAFVPSPTGGFVGYVKSRTPVESAVVDRDLPAFLTKMRTQREVAAYQGWMSRQMQQNIVFPSKLPPFSG